MNERQFARTLNEIAEQEVPATVNLWAAIRAQVRPQQRTAWWAPLRPVTHLGWALVALVVSLAVGGMAYATAPAVGLLFRQAPILHDVVQPDLIQALALSQTLDGITVTLERGYADANRVVIGFTVKGPDGRPYEPRHLTFTDAAGTALPWIRGYGVAGESEIFSLSLPPGEGAYAHVFDASPVTGVPEELGLRLRMDLEELPLPPDAASSSDTESTKGSQSPSVELSPSPIGATAGPLTFEFSLPFLLGQTLEVGQVTEAAGVALTLERVVITPSEERATLYFNAPDGGDGMWLLIAPDAYDLSDGTEAACHQVSYPAGLAGRAGRPGWPTGLAGRHWP